MSTPESASPSQDPEAATIGEEIFWPDVYRAIEELNMPVDEGERAKQVASMETDDYIAAAAILHSVLAPGSDVNPAEGTMKMASPDGETKRELAKPEERLEIFERAAGLIKDLADEAGPDEYRQFLDRAANLAALSVVLAHPFDDGNGRTARTLAHLIKSGFDNNSDAGLADLKTLGSNRPKQGFRIGSFMPSIKSQELTPLEVLKKAAALDIPLRDEERYVNESWDTFSSPYNPAIGPVLGK